MYQIAHRVPAAGGHGPRTPAAGMGQRAVTWAAEHWLALLTLFATYTAFLAAHARGGLPRATLGDRVDDADQDERRNQSCTR